MGLKKWLAGKRWTYWETLTFEWDVSPKSARRAVEKYNGVHVPARAAWVIEHGRIGGRTHAHQLSYYRRGEAPDPSDLWHWWHARYGRAQILEYDPDQYGAAYLVKQIGNQREDHIRRGVDWDIYTSTPISGTDSLPF